MDNLDNNRNTEEIYLFLVNQIKPLLQKTETANNYIVFYTIIQICISLLASVLLPAINSSEIKFLSVETLKTFAIIVVSLGSTITTIVWLIIVLKRINNQEELEDITHELTSYLEWKTSDKDNQQTTEKSKYEDVNSRLLLKKVNRSKKIFGIKSKFVVIMTLYIHCGSVYLAFYSIFYRW